MRTIHIYENNTINRQNKFDNGLQKGSLQSILSNSHRKPEECFKPYKCLKNGRLPLATLRQF